MSRLLAELPAATYGDQSDDDAYLAHCSDLAGDAIESPYCAAARWPSVSSPLRSSTTTVAVIATTLLGEATTTAFGAAVDVHASYTGGGIFPRSGISLVYMESGKTRLMEAARSLLAEHPEREPSTRELYEAAGVAAPTLYHHFGTKDGLLEAVVDEAFSAYLARKRAVPRTGDLLIDFAAGWDMHVGFGVENPVLYALMYGGLKGRQSRAARTAEAELRRGLEQLADAGLLRVGVEEAIGVTTAMAIGCVTQLIHGGGSATDPMASSMRAALMSELTGHSPELGDADQAARLLLARLGSASGLFTPAEEALLCQWLRTLAEHFQPMHSDVDRDVATAELRQDTSEEGREK